MLFLIFVLWLDKLQGKASIENGLFGQIFLRGRFPPSPFAEYDAFFPKIVVHFFWFKIIYRLFRRSLEIHLGVFDTFTKVRGWGQHPGRMSGHW